jgi:diguanylate cyclase (GGDEF)-like protein
MHRLRVAINNIRAAFRADARAELLRPLAQPVIPFGLALIGLMWLFTWQYVRMERDNVDRELEQSIANLVVVVEQNAVRTATELDRILKFIRQTHDRNREMEWQKLVKEEYTVDDEAVQIAIIDRDGMMITSSALLYPPSPVDLSDREHYKVHVHAKDDQLFISKPVMGRASGKWSVQFTRRFLDERGQFAGVVVISLDPAHLARTYSSLNVGAKLGLVLVGDDGIIRAGSGTYKDSLGERYVETEHASDLVRFFDATTLIRGGSADRPKLVASRRVTGYPLKVVIDADGLVSPNWLRTRDLYYSACAAISCLIIVVMLGSAYGRQRFESKIVHLARHDTLTGLSNRLHFRELLDNAYDGPVSSRQYALLVIDLDGFKAVNDSYGHPTGDALLMAVSQRLRESLRDGDTLTRLGGDEFAIIQCVNDFKTDAAALASRLCDCLRQPFDIDSLTVSIGASIGIAYAAEDAPSTVELLRVADLALYNAKESGRGTYRFYSEELNAALVARRTLETGLVNALRNGEFEVFYQPIVALPSNEVAGYEALIRWRHPERGLVSPVDFIPIAEETGLIVPMGEWILKKACRDLALCPGNSTVAVNISPLQFRDEGLLPAVRAALAESGLPASRLKVEITESTLMENDHDTIQKLESLRDLGVLVSMDDFGTGYSCLGYLQKYPINCIKIDRSFVMTMGSDRSGTPIVRAIIALANSLNMTTVAEGVETREQLQELTGLGCNYAQGFLFSRPLPARDILPGYGATQAAA